MLDLGASIVEAGKFLKCVDKIVSRLIRSLGFGIFRQSFTKLLLRFGQVAAILEQDTLIKKPARFGVLSGSLRESLGRVRNSHASCKNQTNSERPDDYTNNMNRLAKKYDTAREHVPQPEIEYRKDTKIGFLAFGTTHWAIIESQDQLQKEYGMSLSYYRLRAVPFSKHLVEFFEKHDRVYVVEQNRDAQMASLIKLELSPELGSKIRSILHYSGLPIDARFVTDAIIAAEKEKK